MPEDKLAMLDEDQIHALAKRAYESTRDMAPIPDVIPLELVRQMISDPAARANIEVLEKLVALQERMDVRRAVTEFQRAMNAAQAEMEPVTRTAQNEHTRSKYAVLEVIDSAVRPIYIRHGFSLTYDNPQVAADGVTVSCKIMHNGGHSETRSLTGGLDTSGSQGKSNKTPIQALGSTVTYLRRYLLCMIFNVVLRNEDKDGNRAGPGFIVPDQVAQLRDLIFAFGPERVQAITDGLLAYLGKPGPPLESLARINSSDFRKAVTALEAKARQEAK